MPETQPDKLGSRLARASVDDPATNLAESLERALVRHKLLGEPAPKVGRYQIVRRLGSGAMGVVYAGHDGELDRTVAIKLLHRRTNDAAQLRFAREAQGLARLSHPNVVQIYEVGEHEGASFMAMEFVDGQTLGGWREQQQTRPWSEVLPILIEAGRGLAAAHRKGLVHRDFKPENVMIDSEGRVRVMDFGLVHVEASNRQTRDLEFDSAALARRAGRSGTEPGSEPGSRSEELGVTEHDGAVTSASPMAHSLTKTGSVLGTPAYMSPEQYSGLGTDARTDQFSYCVTAWELLYGQRPFTSTNIAALFSAIAEGRRDDPPADIEVPGWIHKAIVRGLAPNPSDRWPSMDALLDALSRDPTRRRRWVVAGVSAAVITLALLGARELRGEAQRDAIMAACAVEAESITTHWNPEREAALAAGFAATKLAFADESWARTGSSLAAYADEWASLRETSCVEAELEQGRSPAQQAKVRDCLDEAELAFAATLEVLASADASLVAHAGALPRALPELSACLDERRLAERVAPPEAIADRVPELRAKLARVRALHRSARFEPALALAHELLPEFESNSQASKTPGWPAFEAELHLAIGEQQHSLGRFEDAAASFRVALDRAAAARDDALALRCATKLARVNGYDLARFDEGRTWLELGATFVTRLGVEGSVAEALLIMEGATLAIEAGEAERAFGDYDRALTILEAELGPNHPHVAVALHNLGSARFMVGELDEAAAAVERSWAIREQVYGPHHPIVADSLASLGTIRDEQLDYDRASALHQRALAIREIALGRDHPRVASSLASLALLDLYAGDFEPARPRLERALRILEQAHGPNHPRIAEIYDYLAAIAARTGDLEGALAWTDKALAVREVAFGREHPVYAHALGNAADLHSMLGDNLLAKQQLEQALAINLAALGPEHPDVGHTYRRLGNVAAELGELDEALAQTSKGLELLEAAHGPEHPDLASGLYTLGSIQLDLGDAEAGVKTIQRAIAIEQFTRQGEPVIGMSAFLYARALWVAGERESGREWAEAAIVAYRGEDDPEGLAEVEAWLAETR